VGWWFRLSWESDIPVLEEVQDDFGDEPVEGKWAFHGAFQLVGNGSVTNASCGMFKGFKGCIRDHLHDKVGLDGVDYTGKAFIRIVRYGCDKPSCPVCFKSGWAVREAGNIERRLKEASKRFGSVEHIVASVPVRDYGLKFESLRKKVLDILVARGVVGGTLIFHGARYNLQRHWYWSPHFHVLGFISGGCRGCKKGCLNCGGFEGRTRRAFEKDGYIVKVFDKRKTVFGTAWYQLNHSSLKVGVVRFHIATWFGVCSYRKLKVVVQKPNDSCPICGEELVRLHHLGVRRIVKVKGESGYVPCFYDSIVGADGSPNWCEAPKVHFGSGN